MSYPIYYLLSQENSQELANHEQIMSTYKFVDPLHMDNIFEVIQLDTLVYKIIHVHKNKHKNFKIGDVIYLSGGMLSFYTKTIDGHIDEGDCFTTVVIEKEKITFFHELIDTKIDELIDLINNIGISIKDTKYNDIKDALNFFHNA